MVRGLLWIIGSAAFYFELYWITSAAIAILATSWYVIMSAHHETKGGDLPDSVYEEAIYRIFGRYW